MHTDIVRFFKIEPVSFVQHDLIINVIDRTMTFDLFDTDTQFSHLKDSLAILMNPQANPNMTFIMENSIS